MSTKGGVDGGVDFLLARHVDPSDDVAVVVRHDLFNHVAGEHLFSVDDAGNFQDFGGLTLEFSLKVSTLLATWKVPKDGFVDGGRWFRDAVHHDFPSQSATLEPHPRRKWRC